MKAMPFWTADETAVEVAEPTLMCGGVAFAPNEPVVGWDYLSDIQIIASASVAEEVFRSQTGLTRAQDLDGVVLILQADCHSTGTRHVASFPITSALGKPGSIELSIPQAAVANQIDVRVEVVLDRPDSRPRPDRAAHLRGSRLYTAPEIWRFSLEGAGSAFPTEAVDFRRLGLPEQAPWHLRVTSDPSLPFMAAVRLQVNHAHPAAKEMLQGGDSPLVSMLFHDLLLQMLLALSDQPDEDLESTDEDSFAAVLEGHCATFLDCTLREALGLLREEPADLMTRLKAGTGFASGVTS